MSSLNIDRCDFAVGTVPEAIPERQTQNAVVGDPDAALAARAVVVAAALGGGIWYLLWKVSIYIVLGH